MNLTPALNRPRPTWRDEVLAVPVVALAIVVMIVLELWKWGSQVLKGACGPEARLNEFIAGAYILSLADFRYMNNVSTQIKGALAMSLEQRGDQ